DKLDDLLENRAVARLYWAMSRMDSEARDQLQRSPGLQKLLPVAGVLDFFGSYISVRSGKVLVPGGAQAESAWKELVGAGPEAPEHFITRLLARDKGWLAAYFDALSRVDDKRQSYFAERTRLRRFYEALRGKDIAESPARPVFRPDAGLLLLVSRLQLGDDGQPCIPGNLDVWKQIFRHGTGFSIPKEWASRAGGWKEADQLVEGLFGVSRIETEDAPLQAYLAINEVDRGRSAEQRLTPQSVRQLAEKYPLLGHQYPLFSEFHDLNNASISRFLSVAENIDRIRDVMLRGNALGIVQAEIGLWQILARQGQIPRARLNDSWQQILAPFSAIRSSAQLYDAARAAFADLERAASGKAGHSQDEIIALLAAPAQDTAEGRQMQQELAHRIHSVLQDQRLVSLDTLFGLGDGLAQLA